MTSQVTQRLKNKLTDTNRLIERTKEILNEEMADEDRKKKAEKRLNFFKGRAEGVAYALQLVEREEMDN